MIFVEFFGLEDCSMIDSNCWLFCVFRFRRDMFGWRETISMSLMIQENTDLFLMGSFKGKSSGVYVFIIYFALISKFF